MSGNPRLRSLYCRKALIGVGHALFVLSDNQLTRIFHSANNASCCALQIVGGWVSPLSLLLWKGANPHGNFIVLTGLTRCVWRSALCHRCALFCPHCTRSPRFGSPSRSVWVGVRLSGPVSSAPPASDRVSSGLQPQCGGACGATGRSACLSGRQGAVQIASTLALDTLQPKPRSPHRRPRFPLSGQRYAVRWSQHLAGDPRSPVRTPGCPWRLGCPV